MRSVQLGDNAQAGISAMAVANTAASALNIAQSLAAVKDSSDVSVSQVNSQGAYNTGFDEQQIKNHGKVAYQNNNNGSVQAGGASQEGMKTLAAANIATSAVNIGQNLLFVTNADDLSATQKNDQYAENYAETSQKIKNKEDVARQNNNNGSVQLGDSAQSSAKALVLANIANSAANIGQNVLDPTAAGETKEGNSFSQKNYQTALNGEADSIGLCAGGYYRKHARGEEQG